MLVITAFDYNTTPPRPLISAVNHNGNKHVFPLYLKGTGKSLWEANKYSEAISELLKATKGPTLVNDVKSHIRAFGPLKDPHQINPSIPIGLSVGQYTKLLCALLSHDIKLEKWRNIVGTASLAYIAMEDRELFLDEMRVYPRYSLDTFTGRSKCTNYNMQGTTDSDDIRTSDNSEVFICFDWISADIRVAAHLSKDEDLNRSYDKSDPYTVMSKILDLPREQCKLSFLKSFYSLDMDAPIFKLFPAFHNWAKTQLEAIESNGYLTSALGRKFYINHQDNRDERSVFNAVVQGTVAHAMQASLSKMLVNLEKYIVSETHDSVIMACRPAMVPHVVNEAVSIMLKPLDELPKFPLKIYVGKRWRHWKLYKEFR
jgi:hypothetical protein